VTLNHGLSLWSDMTHYLRTLLSRLGRRTAPQPRVEASVTRHVVTLSVTGTAAAISVDYQIGSDGVMQCLDLHALDVEPWTYQVSVSTGTFVYLSAQNVAGEGYILATMAIDGVVLRTVRADGAYSIASTSAFVGKGPC